MTVNEIMSPLKWKRGERCASVVRLSECWDPCSQVRLSYPCFHSLLFYPTQQSRGKTMALRYPPIPPRVLFLVFVAVVLVWFLFLMLKRLPWTLQTAWSRDKPVQSDRTSYWPPLELSVKDRMSPVLPNTLTVGRTWDVQSCKVNVSPPIYENC